jgi:hypothetical protein
MTNEGKQTAEALMIKSSIPSVHDSIQLKSINTGYNSAGNGGNGSFSGKISNQPTLKFDPSNSADGSTVKVTTGDSVSQKAYWDAGGANAKADSYSKAHGGTATSSGDQSSSSGYDTSKVYADTTATQTNSVWADQHQEVMAGIGGYGGDYNFAVGGNVDVSI